MSNESRPKAQITEGTITMTPKGGSLVGKCPGCNQEVRAEMHSNMATCARCTKIYEIEVVKKKELIYMWECWFGHCPHCQRLIIHKKRGDSIPSEIVCGQCLNTITVQVEKGTDEENPEMYLYKLFCFMKLPPNVKEEDFYNKLIENLFTLGKTAYDDQRINCEYQDDYGSGNILPSIEINKKEQKICFLVKAQNEIAAAAVTKSFIPEFGNAHQIDLAPFCLEAWEMNPDGSPTRKVAYRKF